MLVSPFTRLLTGPALSSNLRWQKANLCPCALSGGSTDQSCQVCKGYGRFYDAWSANFKAGFIGQDSRSLAAMLQKMGPGEVGDAVIVVPQTAPCYDNLGPRDRIMAIDTTDLEEKLLIPSTPPFTMPPGYVAVEAYVKTSDGLSTVPTAFPTPDSNGRVAVGVPTVLRYRIPRLYEIVRELPRVRTFPVGLPKKVGLKRVDMTER